MKEEADPRCFEGFKDNVYEASEGKGQVYRQLEVISKGRRDPSKALVHCKMISES